MATIILDPDELQALTDRSQHRAQRRILDALGITSRTRPDGSLVVLRAHVEEVLGLSSGGKVPESPEPNWSACA
ncbi:MAG: DUF4224 domain-containing protein [Betaproteobacteria bacterium]|nr:DUF4224 domain-containing protein [Betaproteobacteria bacterium]